MIYEELANMAGISSPTAKKWLSILVSSHIIALVQQYHNNALKRIVKMPLLHFLDTGLAAYLLKWGNPEALEKGAMSGAFFESYVFSEIYKSYLNAGKEPPVFYYRDREQKEIDLLLYQNGVLSPLEIKKAASHGKIAIKNFDVLKPVTRTEASWSLESLKVEIGTGSVICMANDLLLAWLPARSADCRLLPVSRLSALSHSFGAFWKSVHRRVCPLPDLYREQRKCSCFLVILFAAAKCIFDLQS